MCVFGGRETCLFKRGRTQHSGAERVGREERERERERDKERKRQEGVRERGKKIREEERER